MGSAAFRVLPAELAVASDMTAVSGLASDPPVVMVAGPAASGIMTVSAVTDTRVETLWSLGTSQQGPASRRPDIVAVDTNQALVLIPGQALLLASPLEADQARRIKRLKPARARLPDRLFATGDLATGLWARSDGQTLLATLDVSGMRDKQSERPGPRLAAGQAVSLVLRDGAGRDVVVIEDHRTGFQLWRQDKPGTWAHLTADGAGRHGLNAGVVGGVLWGDLIVLATGSTAPVRQALPGMPIRGELIVLKPDGQFMLLAGELRVSVSGLMVPGLSASAISMLDALAFSCLAMDETGNLVVAVSRRNGTSGLFTIASDLTMTVLADPCGPLLGLVCDPSAPGRIRAVAV